MKTLKAGCLAAALASIAGNATAATFVVTSTSDPCAPGVQCLRNAIEAANATTASDTIVFDIPGSPVEPKRIWLTAGLPVLQPLVIDGYTQPGATPNTLEEGTNAQIRIVLDGSTAGEAWALLHLQRGLSDVRGLAIVNGFRHAIAMSGWETSVRGNFLGVEPDGVTRASNLDGVYISGDFNLVGGATPADRNLISGNRNVGVQLYGADAVRNAVHGNLIGTDRFASPTLGNTWSGVSAGGARLTRIGDYTKATQNVIAGNGTNGVFLAENVKDHVPQHFQVISPVAGNAGYAAIDSRCAVPNDPLDADEGANECLNHPVIASAGTTGGELVINGTLDSTPNRTFRIALFGNTRMCRTPRGGEATHYIGVLTVNSDAAGHAAFAWRGPAPARPFATVVAQTGTDSDDLGIDHTSRYSPCVAVDFPDRLFVDGFQ